MSQNKIQDTPQRSDDAGFRLVIVRNVVEIFFFKNFYYIIPAVYIIYALLEYVDLHVFPEALHDYLKIQTQLALMLALLFSNLLFREIPNKLNWLLSGAYTITAKEEGISRAVFFKGFDDLLNHKRRKWFGLFTSVFTFTYYVRRIGGVDRIISDASLSLEYVDLLLYIFPMVFYAYFVGIVVWKLCATTYTLQSIPDNFNVKVHFEHPDNAGGLLPIGLLSLSMIYVTVIPTIRSALLLISPFIAELFDNPHMYPNPVLLFEFSPLILAAGIAGSVIALIPVFKFHSVMEIQKESVIESASKLSKEIVELKQKLLIAAHEKDTSSCETIQKQIYVLESVYKNYQSVNTWPIDKQVLTKIWSTQAFLIAQIIALWNWISQFQ